MVAVGIFLLVFNGKTPEHHEALSDPGHAGGRRASKSATKTVLNKEETPPVTADRGGGPTLASGAPSGSPRSASEQLKDAVARKDSAEIDASLGRLISKSDESIGELQAIFQSDADDDTKEFAGEALAKIGTEAATRALVGAIRRTGGQLRDNLLHELRGLSNTSACGPLVEALRDLKDMPLHRECRTVLLEMNSRVPAETLVAAMQNTTTEEERIALAFTISMIHSEAAVPVLAEAGRSRDDLLATRSFMGLARIGGATALAELLKLATSPMNQSGERAAELRTAIGRARLTSGTGP